jgi:enoyl-[acyl-carrier protein] reductase I
MILTNKKILITGLLSERSLAYGIAEAMHEQGAKLAFSYQGPRLKDRVRELASGFNSDMVFQCDVTIDEEIEQLFDNISTQWNQLDGIVHSIASAPIEAFQGNYVDSVTRDNYQKALDVSSYSFVALAKYGKHLLSENSAMLTLSYHGSNQAVPGYNVMGIAKAALESNVRYMAQDLGPNTRVNALSAGPHKTFATAKSSKLDSSLKQYREHSPLKRNIDIYEVGNAAAFLCSDMASAITGEIIYVDGGYHNMDVHDA